MAVPLCPRKGGTNRLSTIENYHFHKYLLVSGKHIQNVKSKVTVGINLLGKLSNSGMVKVKDFKGRFGKGCTFFFKI